MARRQKTALWQPPKSTRPATKPEVPGAVGWTCPKCHRTYKNRNQAHSCVNVSVDDHFRGKPREVRELYDAWHEFVAGITTFRVHAQKTRIAFIDVMSFAGVTKIASDHIDCQFVSRRRIDSPRLQATVDAPGDWFAYRLRIFHVDELDAEVRAWVKEAAEVGKGTSRAPPKSSRVRGASTAGFWLAKTEPDSFSMADLVRLGSTHWDGVRNYEARNNLRKMKVGDRVLIYHSNAKPSGVAGVAEVIREAYPDPTAWDRRNHHFDARSTPANPLWDMVDIKNVAPAKHVVSLDRLRDDAQLSGMLLTSGRAAQLSVQPVEKEHFERILELAGL